MWTLIPGDWRVKPAEWLIQRMNPIAGHARSELPPATGYGSGLTATFFACMTAITGI